MEKLTNSMIILIFFIYTQIVNNFYRIFYGSIKSRKKYKYLLLIELIASFLYLLFKLNSDALAILLWYGLIFVFTLFYHNQIKDNFIYFLLFVCIEGCAEAISSSCFLIIGGLVFNMKDTFMSTMIHTHPLYYIFAMIATIVVLFLLESYIELLSKKVTPQQLKETIKLCLFPVLLITLSVNFIYIMNRNTFIFRILVGIVFVVTNIILIIHGFKRIKIMYEKDFNRKAMHIQMDDINSIDQSYRMIRRKNHDFKNHCLIVLSMLDAHDPHTKDYLLSMKEKYQQEDNNL